MSQAAGQIPAKDSRGRCASRRRSVGVLRETIAPHRKERTEDYYRQIIENHLAPALGALALTELTPGRVRGLIAEKLIGQACAKHDRVTTGCETCVAPLARSTVKNVAATLRAILYQAQQMDELIPTNPAARFGRLFNARHDAREHVTVLEPEQVAKVLQAEVKWYPNHELGVRTLFYTGMREGELLGLQWEDIDWARKGALIVNTPKSGKLRTIDLPASLVTRLRELRSIRQVEAAVEGTEASRWLFPSATEPAKPLNDAWFRDRVWRPLLEKAEVRHIRVHDARHTYASLMLRRGGDDRLHQPTAWALVNSGHG